jgi:fatty-acyl-CoA synthase
MRGAPIVYNTPINAPGAPKGNAARPVVGLIAGAAPPVAVLEGAESIGIKLTHVYGLTEVYGPASVCAEQPGWDELPADQRAQMKRRQGVPYPLEEAVTVLDPVTMQEVPRDGETIGEVMFRGNIVMKGYLQNEKATQEAFAGGWFHTGDLGVLDEHGYVIIKDRSRTSSYPAARTSLPSRSRTSSTNTPPYCSRRSSQNPTRNGAKCPAPSSN